MPSNVDLVRRVFDAAARRDPEAVFALYDPEIEWDTSGTTVGVMGQGQYHGHDGVRSWFREWYGGWQSVEHVCEELIDAGDRVVVLVTDRARGAASGADVELRYAGVWTIQDGKVRRVAWYSEREDALKAAGLVA
jgi:uncharacterized protein